ncbi:RHS repeat domain-containing protein [Microbulbifer sp. JMSA004]|uniref:RHS repeat domain-containing protein n=1 Tax=Microbulbifer sp. JMSA004 TaxID=3243370 RepID=UPI00403A0EDA
MDYGNGISQSYSYDLDGRLETVSASGIGNVRSEFYTYDLANNITCIEDNLDNAKDRGFIYDKLNRLTDEGYIEGENSYHYDSVGNRTQQDTTSTDDIESSTVYSYEASSNRLTSKGDEAWVTDEVGNTTSMGNGAKQYAYNHANRLKTYSEDSILKGTYYYNALGQRVRTDKTEDNLLHYDLGGQYLTETNIAADDSEIQSQVDYIYLDNMPVAQIEISYSEGEVQGSNLTYLHTDHLNTPRIATNESEAIVWRWDSDAFGKSEPNVDPDGDTNLVLVNLRFPGQVKGDEAEHYYNYFRDYDAGSGRYLQSDPIGLNGGINTYGYVYQNPVANGDPTGLVCGTGLCVGAVIGGIRVAQLGYRAYRSYRAVQALSQLSENVSDLQSEIEYEANKSEYHNRCDEPEPPGFLDPCDRAKWQLKKAQDCRNLRQSMTDRWFNGVPDEEHMRHMQQVDNQIKNAERAVKQNCPEQCL